MEENKLFWESSAYGNNPPKSLWKGYFVVLCGRGKIKKFAHYNAAGWSEVGVKFWMPLPKIPNKRNR